MSWSKKVRCTQTPSATELDWRAIEELDPSGWRLCSLEEAPLTGTVDKNYLSYGEPFAPGTLGFIAKKSKRQGDIECVTEEIISRVGRLLPLSIASSRLVRLPNQMPPDIRFMSRNFLRRDREQMLHGAELVALYLDVTPETVHEVFNLEKRGEERRFYRVDMILEVLHWWGRNQEERRDLSDSFGRMLAFDALVGAPDRHALNWAVLERKNENEPRAFAPLFDTARGFFCEHREDQLVKFDREGKRASQIQKYAEKSKPVIGCGGPGGDGVNHFKLIESCMTHQREEIGAAITAIVRAFDYSATERMLRRNFTRIITRRRMEWILELLLLRSSRLKFLLG